MKKPLEMAPQTCRTCRFWNAYDNKDGDPPKDGDCHRYPPTVGDLHGSDQWPDSFTHPATWAADWCGEWAARRKS